MPTRSRRSSGRERPGAPQLHRQASGAGAGEGGISAGRECSSIRQVLLDEAPGTACFPSRWVYSSACNVATRDVTSVGVVFA